MAKQHLQIGDKVIYKPLEKRGTIVDIYQKTVNQSADGVIKITYWVIRLDTHPDTIESHRADDIEHVQ